MRVMPLGDDAAREARRDRPQRFDHGGVERHHRHRPAIARQHLGDAPHQPQVAVEMALELEHQRGAAGDQIAQFAERHHAVGGRLETHRLELGGGHVGEPAAALGEAAQRIVVMHHGLAVGADLEIGFDAEAAGDGGLQRPTRCSRSRRRGIVQAAMGDRPRGQPVEAGAI